MSDPGRLSLSVTHADGSRTRWGPDEVDAANALGRLRFGTTIPGGNKDLTCGLLRHPNRTYADQALFDTVRAYGPGNVTAWEGRMQQFPRTDGAAFAINPGAVGWSAHLRDDPTFAEIYVDREVSRWQPISRARRAGLLGQNFAINDPSVLPDPTQQLPSLELSFTAPWATPTKPISPAFYDAGICRIASVWIDRQLVNVNTGDPQWTLGLVFTATEDQSSGTVDVHDALAAAAAGYVLAATPTRYAEARLFYSTTGVTGSLQYEAFLRGLAVYGDHGLTGYGPNPVGVLASDVVANIVGRGAPLLRFTTGPDGSIEPTSFAIPHLVFADPGTPEDAVLATNIFDLYEWGVYDDREFFYRAPDPERLTWKVRRGDGAIFSHDGLSAEEVFNGVYVRFQDPAGATHTVGPPNSNAEFTDSSLADTSPENPVNAHGIPRRLARLDLSQTTTTAGAIAIGAALLRERALADRKGSLVVPGTATHPTKGERPVWEMRAGDFVEIADHDDTAPRRVIETEYDHDPRTNTLSLDNTVHKLDAILERLGADLVSII